MTARTLHLSPDPRTEIRRLLCDAFLQSANLAVQHGALADDVACALLATTVNFNLDTAPAHQVAAELRSMASELEQLPTAAAGPAKGLN